MLFIANLLLIRDASMHNKRSPKKEKKKKKPRTMLFLNELNKSLAVAFEKNVLY